MVIWLGLVAVGLGLGASVFMPVPQNLMTNFDAGQSLYALGEYEGAIIEYNKIVKFSNRAVRVDSVRVKFGDQLELPVMAAAWYQLGNSRKKSGQHDEAVDAYRHVVAGHSVPDRFRSMVQYEIAESRFLQKKYEDAAGEYMQFVKLFPKSDLAGKAYYYSGWSEFNAKQYDKSIETLKQMLAAYPTDKYAPDAQFRIASAYFEKEEYQTAADIAQQVLDAYSNNPIIAQAEYLKASSLDKLGRADDAIASYRNVRGLYNRMFDLLRGSFREGKNLDFESYRELFETSSLRVAEIFRKDGRFEEAYKELIAVQEIAEERFYKAKVQMRIGDNYMEWKRYDDAWAAYDQVINLYADTPYPPNAQYNKGEARYYAGKYAEARDDYLAVIQNYPDVDTELRALALYNAGFASEKLEDYAKVEELFNEVVEKYPRSEFAPVCLLRLGQLKYKNGQTEEAFAIYEKLADAYGSTKTGADALYGLGILYRSQGKLSEALAAFSKVTPEAGDTYVAALTGKAGILVEQGKSEEGRKMLVELLQTVAGKPDLEAKAYYHLAQLDLGAKKHPEAVAGFTKVIEEYPDTAPVRDAHYGRGLALFNMGKYEKALADYDLLLKSDLPADMMIKVKYSKALADAALARNVEATALLKEVIASQDAELVRSARLKLVTIAEEQDPAEAIATYESMLPEITAPEDREKILVRLANSYYRVGQYPKSIETAQQTLAAAQSDEIKANALFIQGSAYFKNRDLNKALEVFKKVSDQYPQSTWAKASLFQIGVAYNEASSAQTAALTPMANAFKDFYTKYPDDEKTVHAYYYCAWAQYRLGNWKEASRTFGEMVDRFPKTEYAAEALFRAGEAAFNRRATTDEAKDAHFRESVTYFDRLLRDYSSSDYADDALYSKAWSLINLSQQEDAMRLLEEVVTRFPYDRYGPKSQFTVGDYYYSLKEYDKAKDSYQRFLDLYPENKLTSSQDLQLRKKAETLMGHLGEIRAYNLYLEGERYFDEKNYDDAVRIFRDVIEKFPESMQAVNAGVQIGVVYQNLQDFKKAGAAYRDVVEKYGSIAKFETQVEFAKQQLDSMAKAQVL